MKSPLAILHEQVGALLSTDTRTPVSSDGSSFDFTIAFPNEQNFKDKGCDILMLQVEVEWYAKDGGGALEVQLRRIKRNGWKNPPKFFDTLNKEVELFLHCNYTSADEPEASYLPEGYLYPRVGDERKYIIPAYTVGLPFDSRTKLEEVASIFRAHLLYGCNAMWLAAPVFKFFAEYGKEPDAPERLRLLSIAHGTAQVLRPEAARKKGSPPWQMDFPRGFYSTRYNYDAIRRLRPQ